MKSDVLSVTVFLLLFLTKGAYAQNQYYLPHIANGNFGSVSYRTTFILFNNSNITVTATINLTDDAGSPLTASIKGFGTGSQFVINLDGGCSGLLQTDGFGPGIVGAATIAATGPIGVSGIFTVYDVNGNYLTEAGVGTADPLTQFVLPVDSTGPYLTGLALFNPGADTTITMTLFNTDGSQAGNTSRKMKSGSHSAVFLAAAGQLFPTLSNFKGTLLVESTSPVAALVLRQYQSSTMLSYTSLPVVSKSSAKLTLDLAQVANGDYGGISFKTSFLIFNISSSPANVVLTLTQDNGSPFNVTIPGSGPGTGTGSSFSFTLAASASLFLQTDGSGAGTSGAASVTSNVPVGASAVFTVLNVQGRFQTEAGVGDSLVSSAITIPVDVTGSFDTGIAFLNPGGTLLTLTFKLLDANGMLLTSTTRPLPAQNHLATFVDGLFPGLINFRGSLAVSSTGGVAATTLRQYGSGTTYTTLPAVSGTAAGATQPAPLVTAVATGIDALDTAVAYSGTLSRGSVVSGSVNGAAHGITVLASAGGNQVYSAKVNPFTGRYLIVAPDGTYMLTAYYQPDTVPNSMSVTLSFADPNPVQLVSSAVRDIALPAVTFADITGTVSGLGTLPSGVSNSIVFTSSDQTIHGQFVLDAGGGYHGFLPAGSYIVSVGSGLLEFYNLGSLSVSTGPATGNYAIPPLIKLSGVISGGGLTNNPAGTLVAATDTSAPAVTQSFCCTVPATSYAAPDSSGRYQMILAQNRNYAVSAQVAANLGTGMSGSIVYPLTPIVTSPTGDTTINVSMPAVFGGRVQFFGYANDGSRVLTGVIVTASSQSISGAANLGFSATTRADGLYSLLTPFGTNFQLTFVPPVPKP